MKPSQPPKRALIVTADDVGLHRSINQAVIACHTEGVVTACSVTACGQDFDHAIAELRRQPSLAVGVHLTLVELAPLSHPASVKSLLGGDGRFLASWGAFILRLFRGGVRLREVSRELTLQVERIKASGVPITHLNSHQHLHVLPGIRRVIANLAREQGIEYVRIPADRWSGGVTRRRAAAISLLAFLARQARSFFRASGALTCNDSSLGVALAGHLDLDSMCGLIPLSEGVTELITHPGMDNRELASQFGWAYDWRAETEALRDPRLRRTIEENDMLLMNPKDSRSSSRL